MNDLYNITSKGQVTLPKELREAVGLKSGSAVRISLLDARTIAIRAPLDVASIRKLVGKPAGDQPLTESERRNLAARGLL